MKNNRILVGNNLDTLKTLEDNSVNCCITSPPYYGLRDYGTATWVGGDPNCPHKRMNKYSEKTTTGHAQSDLIGNVGDSIYKTICPLCGAERVDEQIGLEETPEQYIQKLVDVFTEVRRVLTDDGTLWLNIGDTYNASSYRKDEKSNGAGKQGTNKGTYEHVVERSMAKNCKPKDLIGIPWMLAFALRESGWYLRQDIIWHKPNPMPEPVKDRFTKSHEYIFLLAKSPQYYFDYNAVQEVATGYDGRNDTVFKGSDKYKQIQHTVAAREHERWKYKNGIPMRNKRDVWSINVSTFRGAHFATFPEELVEYCLLAGCPKDGVVLDPFFGSGTVGVVAKKKHRNYIGCELNPEYAKMAEQRLRYTKKALF